MWIFWSVLWIKLALKIALSFCRLINGLLVYASVIVIFVNVGLRYVSNPRDVATVKCHKHQGPEPVRMLDPGNVPFCENESRWPVDLSWDHILSSTAGLFSPEPDYKLLKNTDLLVRILVFHCCGLGSIPVGGTEILQAAKSEKAQTWLLLFHLPPLPSTGLGSLKNFQKRLRIPVKEQMNSVHVGVCLCVVESCVQSLSLDQEAISHLWFSSLYWETPWALVEGRAL